MSKRASSSSSRSEPEKTGNNHPQLSNVSKGKKRKVEEKNENDNLASSKKVKEVEQVPEEDSIESDSSSISAPENEEENQEDDEDDEDEQEIVDIDFEFFDPREGDFHAIKQLLGSLFDTDAEMFNLSELADMIVKQPLLGSTVKVDGSESDPYALLTVLNMNEHQEKEVIQQLRAYILDKVKTRNPALHSQLSALLDNANGKKNVGLLLTERLVNMPAQVAPPMYKMLCEEIEWALEENEPYEFTHYVLLSKTYRAVASDLVATTDEDGTVVTQKKQKKGKGKGKEEQWGKDMFYFHPEHEIIEQFAEQSCAFPLTHSTSKTIADAKRAFHDFGIIPSLKVFLLPATKLAPMINALETALEG